MSVDKIKILGIVGPSGCGKDTAASYLENKFYHIYRKVKLQTTRPQRNFKDDGYNFITPNEFLEQVLNGDMLNAQEFRGWYYGLSKSALKHKYINVLPMNNEMVMQMLEEHRDDYDLQLIYINTDPKQRLQHILDREETLDCYEVCRRFLSDKMDYVDNNKLKKACKYVVINEYTNKFYDGIEYCAENAFEGD
jgi:guanylate kinase